MTDGGCSSARVRVVTLCYQPSNPNEHAKLRSELGCSLGTTCKFELLFVEPNRQRLFIAVLLYKHHGLGSATQGAKWPSEELDDCIALVRRRAHGQCVADVPITVLILHNSIPL